MDWKKTNFLITTILLFFFMCSVRSPSKEQNLIALINGFLIDGTGRAPVSNSTVIIKEGFIDKVGLSSEIEIPHDADIFYLKGFVILPGFFNTHVHDGYNEKNLKEWAKQGVTTVRDLGNNYNKTLFSKRDDLLKDTQNARLVAAGPIITTVGGYGSFEVNSPEDAQKKIIELIDNGANLIKIAIEDDLQHRRWPMLPTDVINAIMETTHSRRLKVSAHISRAKHLKIAIDTNIDDVAHMIIDKLPEDLIGEMIKKNIYWVPTLELWEGVSTVYNRNWDKITADNLFNFVKGGGLVALGTDYAGYTTHFDLGMPITEILLMYEAGMTPMEIIIAATKNAAHVCNLENKLGTIEEGKIADIIILKNNPLENLNALREVKMVIHNGVVILNNNK